MESGVRSFASQNRDSLPAEELKTTEPKHVEPIEFSTEVPAKMKSTDNLNERESSSSSSSSASDTDSQIVE
jgi:hypothetical protein